MGDWFPNGTAHYLTGGLLIGAAVSFAFAMSGLVTGMSTVFSAAWSYVSGRPFFQQDRFLGSRQWRLALAAGLVLGGLLFVLTGGSAFPTQVSGWRLAAGGFLAGFGARLSNGCTSGHGICGLASFQRPSFGAVVTFLLTGIITARLIAMIGGV
jgi:uncharacterized membrane protein YedE/YeeE